MGYYDPKPKKKKSGGGFFHALTHLPGSKVISQTAKDLGHIASATPGGVVELSKAGAHDLAHSTWNPFDPKFYFDPKGRGKSHLTPVGNAAVKGMKEDFRHPLRHPGYTLVDVLGLAAPAAKGATLGKAALAGTTKIEGAVTGVNMLEKAAKMPRDVAVESIATQMKIPKSRLHRAVQQIGPVIERRHAAEQAATPIGSLDPKIVKSFGKEISKTARKFNIKESRVPKERTLAYSPTEKNMESFVKMGLVEQLPKTRADVLKEADRLKIPTQGAKGQFISTKALKKAIKDQRGPQTVSAEVPASRVPHVYATQVAYDALTKKFPQIQKNRVVKASARRADLLSRPAQAPAQGFKDIYRELRTQKGMDLAKLSLKHPVQETNALVRALRLYRPGYVIPNKVGAIGTNLIQGVGPKTFRVERQLRRNYPEAMGVYDRTMGETAAQAAVDTGGSMTKPPITALTQGIGTSLGKATDRSARGRAFIKEASLRHPEWTIQDYVKNATDPEMANEIARIGDWAENEAIKFTRTPRLPGQKEGAISRVDRELAKRIFLYKWITASSKYSGRMLKEHPTASLNLALAGRDAPNIHDLINKVPRFMEGYVPYGGKVMNMQAASLYDMPGEMAFVLSQLAKGGQPAVDALHERLNPVQHGTGVIARGRDPFRKQDAKGGPFSQSAIRMAARAELSGNPYVGLNKIRDSKKVRERRLFPRTPQDIALQFLLGSWVPEPVNKEAVQRAYEREVRGRAKKHKKIHHFSDSNN